MHYDDFDLPPYIDRVAPDCHVQLPILSIIGQGPKGDKGDKGDRGEALTFDDLTQDQIQQIANLVSYEIDETNILDLLRRKVDIDDPRVTSQIISKDADAPDVANYQGYTVFHFGGTEEYDSDDMRIFFSHSFLDGGWLGRNFYVERIVNGVPKIAGFSIMIDEDGNEKVEMSDLDAAAWREAIGSDNASNLTKGTVPVARLPIATTTTNGAITAAEKKKLNALSVGTDVYLSTPQQGSDGKFYRLALTSLGNIRVDESSNGTSWSTKYYASKDTLTKNQVVSALGYTPLKSVTLQETLVVSSATKTVPANDGVRVDVPISIPSGYKPIAVEAIYTNHTVAIALTSWNWDVTDRKIYTYLRNLSNTSMSVTVTAKIFCQRIVTA